MKRTFKHWTPRYMRNRIVEKLYRRNNPGLPWLTPVANEILSTYLKAEDKGIEFGSGRSTLWFARRVKYLISVEHNSQWAEKVQEMLKAEDLSNVDYFLKPADPNIETSGVDYVAAAAEAEDASLDFALIDGVFRDGCALAVLDKIKPGGVIVIDNVNIYLPGKTFSPNSRTFQQGPKTPGWGEYLQKVAGWRFIWTSNGVSDTAFYFKPLD